jgi:hypothetical protein
MGIPRQGAAVKKDSQVAQAMTKKMTLLALAAACAAMFALPSVASAGEWTLDRDATDQSFTISGAAGTLTAESLSDGSTLTVECTGTTGSGSYSSATTGTMALKFTGCKNTGIAVSCTSPGQPTGTIVANAHITNVYLRANANPKLRTPGITITGPGNSTTTAMSTFTCFFITTTVTGSINGHLDSACDESARTTAHIEFASNNTEGEPKWRYVTENTSPQADELTVNTAGTHRRGSIDAAATVHFAKSSKVTCTA